MSSAGRYRVFRAGRDNRRRVRIGYIGFIFLVSGVLFDPLDGGITKDYCNLSYLFTTSGMGILVVSALLGCELNAGLRCRFLSSVGQNPMAAYTVTGFVVSPVLTLTGAMSLLENLSLGSPFCVWYKTIWALLFIPRAIINNIMQYFAYI